MNKNKISKILYNKLLIRPQLVVCAFLCAVDSNNWEMPHDLLNFNGIMAGLVAILDCTIYELALTVLRLNHRCTWDNSDRAERMSVYMENNGFVTGPLNYANQYYFLKKYIGFANKYLNSNEYKMPKKRLDTYVLSINMAKEKMKEVYEKAMILNLAGVNE